MPYRQVLGCTAMAPPTRLLLTSRVPYSAALMPAETRSRRVTAQITWWHPPFGFCWYAARSNGSDAS